MNFVHLCLRRSSVCNHVLARRITETFKGAHVTHARTFCEFRHPGAEVLKHFVQGLHKEYPSVEVSFRRTPSSFSV